MDIIVPYNLYLLKPSSIHNLKAFATF